MSWRGLLCGLNVLMYQLNHCTLPSPKQPCTRETQQVILITSCCLKRGGQLNQGFVPPDPISDRTTPYLRRNHPRCPKNLSCSSMMVRTSKTRRYQYIPGTCRQKSLIFGSDNLSRTQVQTMPNSSQTAT